MEKSNLKKQLNKVLSALMCVVLLFSTQKLFTVKAIDFPCYATVTAESLNVRNGAGTSYSSVEKVYSGDILKLTASKKDSSGTVWYKVCYNLQDLSKTGYVSSKYVKVSTVTSTDSKKFESYLTEQGFPESYKEQLRILHAVYPNWVFKADKINLNWDTVWNEESKVGRNLVSSSAKASWKSMYEGAYDWSESKYVSYDSGGWVSASPRVVAYYLDPRNLLTASSVFQFSTQKYDDSQTVANVKKMVAGTFLDAKFTESSKYNTYSDLLVYAAKQSGVSPYVLASMILTEQGTNGTGKSISGTVSGYKGYYNYYNIGAYKTSTMSAVERGLWWAKGAGENATSYKRPWNTKAKAIVGGAIWYAENYLSGGQNTLYYKKFNVVNKSAGLYSHQYMTNIQGADTEGKILSKAYSNLTDTALIFNIPVYNNMPSTPYTLPSGSGANNFFLSSLKVSGYSLTPTFNKYTYSYSLIVPNTTKTVKITAKGVQSTTTVSGTGEKTLSVGTNTFSIKAKSESGYSKTYKLNIVREKAVDPPELKSSKYKIETYITGVQPETTVANFKKNFTVVNGEISVLNSKGKSKTSGNIATGDVLKFTSNGETVSKTTVLIKGDTNGDGSISIIDLANVQKHILEISKLNGCYLEAANINGDKTVNIIDLARIQKHLLDLQKIDQ